MRNYYEDRKERYEILKADAVHNIQDNLLFNLHIIPKHYLKEREELISLTNADCKQSFKLALVILKLRYKHCPAKGHLEAILKEYY